MSDEQLARIKEYVSAINKKATDDEDLLEYAICEVFDRVLLYLNVDELAENLERIVARVVSGIFNQTFNSLETTQADSAINSMSDNGQSISYSNEIRNYLSSTDDNEVFASFTKLLAPYRRINVCS
ncbi:MAG: hypothetical protein Q4E47_03325 [Candidatus Saccharibacteria bacterium]|nr:hypothetical protein [Candidatus Saccharibacteria bacterium]